MKASWKMHDMAAVSAAIAGTSSLRQAAKRLGVHVSTISRLVKAGRVPNRHGLTARSTVAPPAKHGPQTPTAWAADVRATYELSATEDQIVGLAAEALVIAQQLDARPSDRLAAMGRFAALTKQLQLPQEDEAHGDATTPIRFPRPA